MQTLSKIVKFFGQRKYFLVFLFFALLLAITIPGFAHAQEEAKAPTIPWSQCIQNPVTCGLFGVTLFINTILGVFIGFASWLVDIGIELSTDVTSARIVTSGFGVALSIANLGFVLGIIIIAIATILRRETYGIKQILWKLVVAAILVNFSLVIAGEILNISDSLTNRFKTSFETGGGISSGISSKIARSFAPQELWRQPSGPQNTTERTQEEINECTQIGFNERWSTLRVRVCAFKAGLNWGQVLEDITAGSEIMFESALNLVFSIVMSIIVLITLLAMATMLIIRYVYVGILLILAPLAWLMWIFPAFSHHWTKWWSNFFRWAFFPPLMIFFLWLAVFAADQDELLQSKVASGLTPDSPAAAAATTLENPNLIATAGMQIMIIVIALGGLFAANSLGIHGASMAIGGLKSAGNFARGAVGGAVWKQTKKAGRAAYQGVGGDKATERMQKGAAPLKLFGREIRIPGMAAVGRGIATATEHGGRELVEKEKGDWSKKDKKRFIAEAEGLGALENEKKVAVVSAALEKGYINDIKKVGGENLEDFLKRENLFKQYGHEETLKGAKRDSGLELKGLVDRGAPEKDIMEHFGKLRQATIEKFADKFFAVNAKTATSEQFAAATKKGDIPMSLDQATMQKMQETIVRGMAKGVSPNNLSNFLRKVTDQESQFKNFQGVARSASSTKTVELSARNESWFDSNTAKDLGVNREGLFGSRPEREKPEPPPVKSWETP